MKNWLTQDFELLISLVSDINPFSLPPTRTLDAARPERRLNRAGLFRFVGFGPCRHLAVCKVGTLAAICDL